MNTEVAQNSGIDGDSPPAEVILHLLQEHPDQWKVKMPEAVHQPSGLVLRVMQTSVRFLPHKRVHVGGEWGLALPMRESRKVRAGILRVMTWQALAQARHSVLEGRDYMRPRPEMMSPFSIQDGTLKRLGTEQHLGMDMHSKMMNEYKLAEQRMLAQRMGLPNELFKNP